VLLWGGSYAAVKAAQAAIPPVPLATFRCLAAAVVLAAGLALRRRRVPRLRAREWGLAALVGLAGNTLFQLCIVGGLRFTTPAHSALLINVNPILGTVMAAVWLGERLGRRRILGIALALAGVALVVAGGGDVGGGGRTWLGDLLSLGAAVGWAVYSVGAKPLLARHPAYEVTTLAMVLGTLPLLPLGLPGLVAVPWTRLSLATWALLGYLSVLTLVLANVLWYWALARAPAARVVVYSYLTPVAAAAVSLAVGQDVLTAPLALGAAAVVAGVALAQLG
jgi:drug/metabolite transporter (DMT)-like permease